MSLASDCPACQSGSHDGHDPNHGIREGLIGGTYCACRGDCAARAATEGDRIAALLERPPVTAPTGLVTESVETLAEVIDRVAAEHEHWAAFDNTGDGDFVCHCGLPWAPGEGCAFVRGARALIASGAVRPADERWNTAVDWLLNAVEQNDFAAPFWAFYDGIITEDELRSESVFVDEINARRAALAGEGGDRD